MSKKKLTLTIILSFMFAIMLIIIPNKSKAVAPSTPVFFGASSVRDGSSSNYMNKTDAGKNIGYAIGNPQGNGNASQLRVGADIWNLMKYPSKTSKTGEEGNYYCIREGMGFAGLSQSNPLDIEEYNNKIDINSKSDITSNIPSLSTMSDDDYKGLIILSNLLFLGGTEDEKIEFLKTAGVIDYLNNEGIGSQYYNQLLLKESDIKAVQQATIWYYSNRCGQTISDQWDKLYNRIGKTVLSYTLGDGNYSSLDDYDLGFIDDDQFGSGLIRNEQAGILYDYLIQKTNSMIASTNINAIQSNVRITAYTSSNNQNAQPIIYIEKLPETTGNYKLTLRKQDANGNTLASTTKFTVNDEEKVVTTGELEVVNREINSTNYKTTDTYTIRETQAPNGYIGFTGTITVTVTKKKENNTYKIDEMKHKVTDASGKDITNANNSIRVYMQNEHIYIEVKNHQNDGKYNLTLVKEDENGEQLDSKAIFEVNEERKEVIGRAEIAKDVEITASNVEEVDEYVIKEIEPPDEYCKFDGIITVTVTKKNENGNYKVEGIEWTVTDEDGNDIKPTTVEDVRVYLDRDTGNIYVEVKNYQNDGKYNITLVKEDENGEQLDSKAIFEVNEERKEVTGRAEIAKDVEITASNVEEVDEYVIKEIKPPDEYCKFDGIITVTVRKKNEDGNYKVEGIEWTVTDKDGNDIKSITGDTVKVEVNTETGNIYVYVKNYQFDLKLIKRIVEVNGVKVPERINDVDITELAKGTETTASYDLNKDPVSVKRGDIVKYTLRIYNEGSMDGYASEITEDVPEGLEFIWSEKTESELDADTTLTEQEKQAIKYNQLIWNFGEINKDTNKVETVTTNYLAKGKGAELTEDGANLIKAFDPKKEYKNTVNDKNPDYKEVSVYMKVVSENATGTIIRNEAAITEDTDKDGNSVDDRDSDTEDWVKYEDDEDYDRVILQSFDLSLRKFITAVSKDDKIEDTEYLKNEDGTYKRASQVDTSKLNTTGEDGKLITTATYNHTKEPIEVEHNDYVVCMIRVYNEGDISGYASEITDHLPPYLQYVDNEFNKQYGWNASDDGRTVKTRYLENHIISKTTKNAKGEIILSYKEVPIMCRVTSNAQGKITNIADITECKDENKKEILDRDSEVDNVKLPEDKDLPNYKDDETGEYIPGQQDDDDFEKLVVKTFDLALRKFITGVNNQNVTNRIPQVKYDKQNNKITYEHTKTPIDVVTGDTVIYTIRVYNEGDINGYASEVSDDIPEGLQYLPNNSLNKEYRWVMYDKDGKETTDISKAVKITTDYLSKEQGEARLKNNEKGEDEDKTEEKENPALLKAFDKTKGITETNPDYADVKVAFKVIEPNSSDRIIINSAQISEDTDEDGNPVDDIDSTPDVWNEGEDDQDKEYIKLNYFDLALRKWVTQAIVIENGKETITQTGHKPEDDPEQVVKVELHRKKLSSLTVKFKYSIKITNEGDIAGYAKEITDYVPEGLKFVATDNPDWVDKGNNVITTRKLENTLLQPGESADVEVILTWINNSENMGLKVNTAEISEDYNDRNVPDRDSTPNNKKPGEDDIDDAPVLLSISTGQQVIYFTLGFSVLMTLSSGIVLIRKFVL